MKFGFCGSSPSAIHPTFTPAPVMPSDAAVGSFGSYEAVCVSDSPSGASCGLVEQAPGITLGVTAAAPVVPDLAGVEGLACGDALPDVASGAPKPAWMVSSGRTSATAELAFSRDSSPAETVAAIALIVWYCLTWVACTWFSSLTR